MTSLHGAIAIEEMDDITGTITQALDLNVSWLVDVLLNEAPAITKGIAAYS